MKHPPTLYEFTAAEAELIAVALDGYRRTLKRERRAVRGFLARVRQCFSSEQFAIYQRDCQQELARLNSDMRRCRDIQQKLQE
mgnify:CR=1 FL=1